VGSPKLRVTAWGDNKFQQPSIALGAEVEIGEILPPISEDSEMTAFRFIFPDDDDEGFELVHEEKAETTPALDDDGEEEATQVKEDDEDEVIWEETEEED
jgi:hypothetical protein